MKRIKINKIGYITFLLISLGLILFFILYQPKKITEEPKYEPAPPEAPRLSSLGAIGETVKFESEVRYYEIKVPAGNPVLPQIWANALSSDTELKIYQAFFAKDSNEASARIYLDDGKYQNSYEVKFVKDISKGFILQYDDRYTFTPQYKLKDGEVFTYSVESEGGNVTVNESGVIRAVGVSDTPSNVKAYVGEKLVDSFTVTKTVKAVLDMFIVAGQGNAAGEGGNIEESIKPLAGTAYTVELDDREYKMQDLSEGRKGFTPALAAQWYLYTGEKALFVQTAVSDVSVTKWTKGGEAYQMALTRIEYFKNSLSTEGSPFELNRVFCVWLQGEWDIAHGMTSDEYIYYFNDFYTWINESIDLEMTAIIPVRASLVKEGEESQIAPICSAQYMLGNMYDELRIITRITEDATIENGMVGEGNLYYTQNGYNEIGKDAAFNLYNCYSSDTDKSVRKIELFGNTHKDLFKYGETVELRLDETIRTVAVVSPLYAETTRVQVDYDENLLTYTKGGLIGIAETNDGTTAEMLFSCGDIDFKFNVKYVPEDTEAPKKIISYLWEFNDLSESMGTNNLTLSERSNADQYTIADGVLVSAERQADFVLGSLVELTSEADWEIEWTGLLNDNGIILGNGFSTKGYIYLAPYAQNMGYSVRLVDNDGQTIYLAYGEYAEANRDMNGWKIGYTQENRTIVLYANGVAVSEYKADKPFSFSFTNLLGRYGSENVNYCYTGSLDSLKITFASYEITEQGE